MGKWQRIMALFHSFHTSAQKAPEGENEKSCLIITNKNEKNNKINDILNKDNKGKVCKCSVKRVGNNPEITDVEEYLLQQ